ncbi:MAG: hypothetical protein ACLU0T_06140 [Bacteroidales bacterium]
MHGAFALVDQAGDGLVDDGGGGDARVADGEVEDRVVADLRFALEAVANISRILLGAAPSAYMSSLIMSAPWLRIA